MFFYLIGCLTVFVLLLFFVVFLLERLVGCLIDGLVGEGGRGGESKRRKRKGKCSIPPWLVIAAASSSVK